jgi:hypothetical protein
MRVNYFYLAKIAEKCSATGHERAAAMIFEYAIDVARDSGDNATADSYGRRLTSIKASL